MEKKPATRNYLFSDGVLVVKANNIITCARRDAAEFTLRGATEANTFTPLADAIDLFKDLPTDEELLGIQQEFTENKNKKADTIKVQIRTIMTAAKITFGDGSSRYNRFGTKGLDAMSDPELLKAAGRVARTTTGFASQLAARGVTAATVTSLYTLAAEFEALIDDREDAANDRNIADEERIEAGNALYNSLVQLADTGKDIWVTKNEAKYNDYVIHNTRSGEKDDTPAPPTP